MQIEYKPRQRLPCRRRWLNVLNLLKEHGPLTISAMSRYSEPHIPKREVRKVISRLCELNLIYPRERNPPSWPSTYQINQRLWARKKTAFVMKCKPNDLLQPQHRFIWVYYNLRLAHWYMALKQNMGSIEVYRKFDPYMLDWKRKHYSALERDKKYLPDLLLVLQNDRAQKTIVPVKFICSLYQPKHVYTACMRAAKNTSISGQVFIGNDGAIRAFHENLLDEKIQRHLIKNQHDPDKFFAFSLVDFVPTSSPIPLALLNADVVRLENWIHQLNPIG